MQYLLNTYRHRVCGCIPASAESAETFQQMLDLSLLKDPIFIMFAVSNFLTSIGFNVPYVYTVVSLIRQCQVYSSYTRRI